MNKKANLVAGKMLSIGIGVTCILIAVILSISNVIQMNRLKSEIKTYQDTITEVNDKLSELSSTVASMHDHINTLEKSLKDDTKVNTPTVPEKVDTSNIMPESYEVQITAEDGLRVRRDPSLNGEIITVISYGTKVTVINNRNSSWYQLNNAELYENGYIFKEYTTTDIDEATTVKPTSNTSSMSITEPSNLSAEEFNAIIETFAEDRSISDSALIGAGEALVALEEKYEFNGLFALSVAGLESGFGVTNAAMNHNNPLGIMGGGKITSFDSIHDAFNNFGSFISKNYINNGRTSISSIGAKYCPSTASKWTNDVTWFWNKLTTYV